MDKKKFYDICIMLGLILASVGLVAFPVPSVEAGRSGVKLCLEVIIPSLFPFFVLASLAVSLGITERLGKFISPLLKPLFGVSGNGAGVLLLGLVGGYPVGARGVTELYRNGRISKDGAERMLAFSNNSGPAFIFGVVGSGVFRSAKAGLVLYIIHIVSAMLVSAFFRGSSGMPAESVHPREGLASAFTKAVTSSFNSTLGLCGFVVFFSVFTSLLGSSGVMRILCGDNALTRSVFTGFLELTGGICSLPQSEYAFPAAALLVGWGGVSVHFQTLSLLYGTDLSPRKYFIGKALQGCISFVLALVCGNALGIAMPESISAFSPASAGSAVLALRITFVTALLLPNFYLPTKRGRKS